jgi:hypothetical protein
VCEPAQPVQRAGRAQDRAVHLWDVRAGGGVRRKRQLDERQEALQDQELIREVVQLAPAVGRVVEGRR